MVMNFSVHACRQWVLNGQHSEAVGFVVNGVLRTLWISSTMQNQLSEVQA